MSWPTPQDYNEAIQNPSASFDDPVLKQGSPELTALGIPKPITGNFASVYRLYCNGRPWAVRCFWRATEDLHERYSAISRHLEAIHLPYTVGFEFLERGIRIRGTWYPIVKMEWVEGELLSTYIERHLEDPKALRKLADRWVAMMRGLEEASMAHGDLQHGNVLVVGADLKLVDYDGMFVPGLEGKASHELGHQNYQHPLRSAHDFGPELDRFSFWVIFASLVALQHDPSLWSEYGGGDECLLLRKSDFDDPAASKVLARLQLADDRPVREMACRIREISTGTLHAIPLPRGPSREVEAPSGASGWSFWLARLLRISSGRPLLLRSRDTASIFAPKPRPADTWIAGSPQRSGLIQAFSASRTLARVAMYVFVLSVALLAPAIVVRNFLLVKAWGAAAAAALSVVVFLYVSQPAVRERLRLRFARARMTARLSRRSARIKRLRRRLDRANRRRVRLEASVMARRDAVEEWKAAHLSRVSRTRGAIDESIRRTRSKLETQERLMLTTTLGAVQREHLRNYLRARRIQDAGIPRLGRVARLRLALSGLRTCEDVRAEALRANMWLGEARIRAFVRWRLSVESAGRRSVPPRLPAYLQEPIVARFRACGESVSALLDVSGQGGQRIEGVVELEAQRRLRRIDLAAAAKFARLDARVARLEGDLRSMTKEEPFVAWQLSAIDGRVQAHSHLTFLRFVRYALSR